MDIISKIFLLLFGVFIIPYFFMLIWNNIMPTLCNFNLITYEQSFFLGLGLRLINGSIGIRRDIKEK